MRIADALQIASVMTYTEFAKSVRLPLGFLLAFLYLVFAEPNELGLWTGGAIALAGVLIRTWASGHIEKTEVLATAGPYAHTRNPLYFGSFLIAAGFAIAVDWWLLLIVIAFFALVYAPTMERERATMSGRFPGEYAEYAANVPAFMPRPLPWRAGRGEARPFRWELFAYHGEWKVLVTYVLVMAFLVFRLKRGF